MIPNYEQLLRVLRELTGKDYAGLYTDWTTDSKNCCYCDGDEEWVGFPEGNLHTSPWQFKHEDDCPITIARRYIEAYDQMAVSGWGPREDQEHKEFGN